MVRLIVDQMTYLEENDHQEDEDSREYVIDIGESSSLEGVLKSIHLIGSLHERVEEIDDGTFILI